MKYRQREDKVTQDNARQHKTTQDNTRQRKTAQDNARQRKTTQDSTRQKQTPTKHGTKDRKQDTYVLVFVFIIIL